MPGDLKSMRVLVTPTTFGQNDPRLRTELEATVGEVVYNKQGRPLTSVEVGEKLRGVDGYIAGLDKINREALEGADVLKVIARYGVGVDNVDFEAAASKSIVVTNTPHANSVSVAELTVGLMISLARSIPQNSVEVRAGRWPPVRGVVLQGKTIGLLGFGAVGKEVARRLYGWGCRLIAYDPLPNAEAAQALAVEMRTFDEVVSQADFLSLHVPVLPETRHMVNAGFLSRMKREGAFLINTARGELADESALFSALQDGQLRGIALDVFSEEPPGRSNTLLQLPQVIITPHCGAHTDGAMDAMGWGALRDCLAVLRGEQPAHPVIPKREISRPNSKVHSKPTMHFIGVTTANSLIMEIFPAWMRELRRTEVTLEGVDLALHDRRENYRSSVAQIKHDPQSLGALVTTHKIDLLGAARDMFDYLDPYAVTCGEVSCISKNGPTLEGHAKDPITAGMSLDSVLGEGYFGRSGAEVLCFGAGGAARSIILHFAEKRNSVDRPLRIVVVDCLSERLERLEAMLAALKTDLAVEYHHNVRPEVNHGLMAQLPPGSVVINATGMGKDIPGSPISDKVVFPFNGVAWELNYRGELRFLCQALEQAESRKLVVEDGWLYFLHGWTQVIAQVLKVKIDGGMFEKLATVAGSICRPTLSRRVVPNKSDHKVRVGSSADE